MPAPLRGYTEWAPYLFAFMTFVMAMGCSPQQVKQAMRMPLVMLVTLLLVHIAAPLAAYGLGAAVYGPDSPYVIGFVLFAIIPLGVSSILWVGMAEGNIPLALTLVVLDSALSPFVVPAEIALFFGADISFDHTKVMGDLLIIVVIPTILGVLVNHFSRSRAKSWSAPVAGPASKLAMYAVVAINAAAIEPYMKDLKADLPLMIPLVVFLVVVCYVLGFAGAWLFRKPELTVTLLYAAGMRNISLGIVLGLGYFEPKAAVPVVISTLIQQPMATVMHKLVARLGIGRKTGVQQTARR
ncbi:bile acid:sodium symporter family protein [Paenibacillus sp. MBLB4367]|uniref:bile acid:sodium symporter family protein n=1 Tax=Paenibacillus sp. MBLB4367 TaxID=3384767 RepID=UPI0039081904